MVRTIDCVCFCKHNVIFFVYKTLAIWFKIGPTTLLGNSMSTPHNIIIDDIDFASTQLICISVISSRMKNLIYQPITKYQAMLCKDVFVVFFEEKHLQKLCFEENVIIAWRFKYHQSLHLVGQRNAIKLICQHLAAWWNHEANILT